MGGCGISNGPNPALLSSYSGDVPASGSFTIVPDGGATSTSADPATRVGGNPDTLYSDATFDRANAPGEWN